jgi:hypothetical protein
VFECQIRHSCSCTLEDKIVLYGVNPTRTLVSLQVISWTTQPTVDLICGQPETERHTTIPNRNMDDDDDGSISRSNALQDQECTIGTNLFMANRAEGSS